MRRHSLVSAVAVALLAATAGTASADPQTIPNGPWVQERQHVSLERLHDYGELVGALRQIERQTRGRVSVEVIGQSNEGRDIHLASVGTGPTKVLYITQQHGNEPLGTEAALQLLQRAGNGGAGWDAILRQITLLVVPRVNPDGAERFQRENHDPDCAGAFCTPGVGFDVNRWHDPAVSPEANPVPEAAAIQRAFARHRPSFVVDFHHQGSYVSRDGDLITTSIFWPLPLAGMPPSAVTLSKQVCVVIDDTLAHYGFAEVSQYPGTSPRGIARNSYGLLGAGSVLVEFRGDIGQKSAGMLTRTAFTIMGAVAESIAEGTVYSQDPARADAIPRRGPSVDDPHE